MQGQLSGIPRRIEQRDFLSSSLSILGGVGFVYNYAHKIADRGRVFDSIHPSNAWYANTLDAIIHADGLVSAVASSKRPWHLMKFAFAPGFFDSIQCYLLKSQSEQVGTGQPATRPESDSEGSDKPQPESEGLSW